MWPPRVDSFKRQLDGRIQRGGTGIVVPTMNSLVQSPCSIVLTISAIASGPPRQPRTVWTVPPIARNWLAARTKASESPYRRPARAKSFPAGDAVESRVVKTFCPSGLRKMTRQARTSFGVIPAYPTVADVNRGEARRTDVARVSGSSGICVLGGCAVGIRPDLRRSATTPNDQAIAASETAR